MCIRDRANPDYYKGKPGVDSLTFRVIPEGTNRTIALETGEADIAYDIDPVSYTHLSILMKELGSLEI